MKKFLLASALLSSFLLVQGMEEYTRIPVCTGGYYSPGEKQYREDCLVYGLVDSIKNTDNKVYCTFVADGHSECKVVSLLGEQFLSSLQGGLVNKKSIKESLCNAAQQCEKIGSENKVHYGSGSTLVASCFDEYDKKLHIVWLGDLHDAVGANFFYFTSDHKPTEENKYKRNSSFVSEPGYLQCHISSGNDFYIGASDGFWNKVKKEEVASLIEDAKFLPEKNFCQRYCNSSSEDLDKLFPDEHYNNDDNYQDLMGDFERGDADFIARRLCNVAFHRGSKKNIAVAVTLFGHFKDARYVVSEYLKQGSNVSINDNKFLSVDVGGYADQKDGQKLCKVIWYQGDEWKCFVIVGNDPRLSAVVKNNFFTRFEKELRSEKSVKNSLENAYQRCKPLFDAILLNKPLKLFASCFDVKSKVMHVLTSDGVVSWLGDSVGAFL